VKWYNFRVKIRNIQRPLCKWHWWEWLHSRWLADWWRGAGSLFHWHDCSSM